MILLCPECHWSVLAHDGEVAARGGPGMHRCEACNTPLKTLDEGLGLGTSLSTASSAADFLRESGTMPPLHKGTLPMTQGMPRGTRPMEQGMPSSSSTFPMTWDGGNKPPPGQVIIGPAPTQFDGDADTQTNARAMGGGDGRMTAIDDDDPFGLGSMMADPDDPDSTIMSTPLPHRPTTIPAPTGKAPAVAPRPADPAPEKSSGRGAAGLAVGCALLIGALVVLAGIGAGIYYFTSASPSDASGKVTPGEDDEGRVAPPERPPLAERVNDLVRNHQGTSVPAIKLPEQLPSESELVLLTPNGVVYNQEIVASVNVGRVDPGARPTASSPLIIPLARQLEGTFTERMVGIAEAEAEATPRRLIVLGDSATPYDILYNALYTGWERGARLQLGSINPSNPSAFLVVEVVAQGWPAPIAVSAPDDLPGQNPAVEPSESPALKVEILADGYRVRAPGQSADDAEFIKKDMTTYPIKGLQKAITSACEANGEIKAVLLVPEPRTSFFTILQSISAIHDPIAEIRLAAP